MLVNHYAIWPPILKTIFIKHSRVEIIACPFVLFYNDRFFNVFCIFHQQFSAAYVLKLILLPQRAHTILFIRCDNPEITRWCLCSVYAGIQMSPDEVWAAVTVVAMQSQKALLMCPYVSSGKFSVLALCCSRAFLHDLQFTSDCCLIFASHLATGMIPAIAIISRLLCLQGTRGSFEYFLKNAPLSFRHNMKSAVHVPYAG